MTRLLSIDTSTWWAGIAIVERAGDDEPRVLAELGVAIDGSHAGALLGRVERLLEIAGLSRSQLDGYVAVRGPGSFTGVRIGLGTLRGLGVATDRPCFGVNGLAALAAACGPVELERVAAIDAGRGELYVARFDAAGEPPAMLVDTQLAGRTELPPVCGAASAVLIPGPGTDPGTIRLPEGWRAISAPRTIAAAAGRLAAAVIAGRLDDARIVQRDAAIEPLYVRLPDAILNRRER